jgi:hypothetical protein
MDKDKIAKLQAQVRIGESRKEMRGFGEPEAVNVLGQAGWAGMLRLHVTARELGPGGIQLRRTMVKIRTSREQGEEMMTQRQSLERNADLRRKGNAPTKGR